MKDRVLLISLGIVVLAGLWIGFTASVPSTCKLPPAAEPDLAGPAAEPAVNGPAATIDGAATSEGPAPILNDSGDIGKPCDSDDDCSLPMSYAVLSHCPYQMRCPNGTCEVYCPFDELNGTPEGPANGTTGEPLSDANSTETAPDYGVPDDTLILFWAVGCPVCAAEKDFLEEMAPKYPQLSIMQYEVTENDTSLEMFLSMCAQSGVTCDEVPVTFIDGVVFEKFKAYNGSLTHYVGEPSFVGHQNQIEKAIRRVLGFPADEADMAKWAESLKLRVTPDKAVYVSRDDVNLQISLLSSENVENCVIRARGVHDSGEYHINDYKRVELAAGDNEFVLTGQLPACFSCSGFQPGEYDTEVWVEYGGEELAKVKLKITVVA